MSSAAINVEANDSAPPPAGPEPALPLRGDTLLGVCEAVGQDLGFNPTWLRMAFAALFLWNPEVVVACYLGLGVAVASARLLFPVARKPKAQALPSPSGDPVVAGDSLKEKELLAA